MDITYKEKIINYLTSINIDDFTKFTFEEKYISIIYLYDHIISLPYYNFVYNHYMCYYLTKKLSSYYNNVNSVNDFYILCRNDFYQNDDTTFIKFLLNFIKELYQHIEYEYGFR